MPRVTISFREGGLPFEAAFPSGGLSVDVAVTGLAARAPYMHTGCAATLRDRLSYAACGGSSHGHTARLNGAQLDDLVAYLASL